MKTYALAVLLSCASVAPLSAQTADGFPVGEKFLKGYAQSVAGEVLSYWSFHPFAKQSLLTRATTGDMAIEWKTEPVPAHPSSDRIHFLWIGAFSTGTSRADHSFDFFINGKKSLTFRTLMGGHYDDWSVGGTDGVRLSYKHVWKDHVGDAHGYFCLSLPSGAFVPGQPLTLKTVGHASETRDWYMTFAHAVRESALVRPLPILVRQEGFIKQPIEVDIDYPADNGLVEIQLGQSVPVQHSLKLGWNAFELLIDAVTKDSVVTLDIGTTATPRQRHTVTVRPVTQRRIALLPHSHNDIGYSDLQTTVLDIQIQNIRDALRLIRASRDYPKEARFKWNVEILWPIDSLLRKSSAAERAAFLGAVREGSIGLNAMYVNPLTGICRPEVLLHLMDFARELKDSYDISIPTAMITDIPGTSWGIVPALAQAGVRYFTSGPNAGDRIGHYTNAWGDKPFYWVSPSGKDSVLMWVAGTGYSMFHATRTFRENQGFRQKLHEYLDRLESISYPYELVQMRYSIYSDNGMTDSTMSDFVREWNERTVSPVLAIATTEELFREFEQRYGRLLPSYSGDLTPYWEDGAASTARELGIGQRASERLVQAGILEAMTNPHGYDHRAYSDAWDAVNLWVEHTWGAWNSVSDPDEAGAVAQWLIKQEFAQTAERRTKALMKSAMNEPSAGVPGTLEVVNTASWARSDVVIASASQSVAGDRIEDESGNPVPSQRLSSGELAFLADDIPPFGTRRYRISAGPGARAGRVRSGHLKLSNSALEVTLDETRGDIQSLRTVPDGREYVNHTEIGGLNDFVYVAGTSPSERRADNLLDITVGEDGPLVASLVATSQSAGCNSIRREYRILHGADRIDIINTIDKQAVRTKEAAYFRFPFAVDRAVTRLDLGLAVIRPGDDQLPGSCKDFFSVQRWVDVSSSGSGVTWSTVEAPLVELGEITDETPHNSGPSGWKTDAGSSPILYSFVMNNYWHTNYKADQQGLSEFHYSMRPHTGFDPVAAYRFGVERNQPLLVRTVEGTMPAARLPFQIDGDAAVTGVMPSRDGKAFLVRLYNPDSENATAKISWRDRKLHRILKSDFLGTAGPQMEGPIILGPFELLTLWLER